MKRRITERSEERERVGVGVGVLGETRESEPGQSGWPSGRKGGEGIKTE